MSGKALAFMILTLILQAEPFRYSLHDMTPILDGAVGAALSMELSLLKSDLGNASFLSECSLCIALNASTCHCFEEPVDKLKPSLPAGCASKHHPFYISLFLKCKYLTTASIGLYIPPLRVDNISYHDNSITLVLPVQFGDLERYVILLKSFLRLKSGAVHELLVIVPDKEQEIFRLVSVGFSELLLFNIVVIPESVLLPPPMEGQYYYPYAIQMALKLLVSQIVSTQFYLTLDSDIVLLRSFEYKDLIIDNRGIYHHEGRFTAHPDWWDKSEAFLGFKSQDPASQGIGATPVVMSTYGSMLVLKKIEEAVGKGPDFVPYWVSAFGANAVWSEYTLYRIVLDHFKVNTIP